MYLIRFLFLLCCGLAIQDAVWICVSGHRVGVFTAIDVFDFSCALWITGIVFFPFLLPLVSIHHWKYFVFSSKKFYIQLGVASNFASVFVRALGDEIFDQI